MLSPANHVLQKHDRVIDQEADRESHRHQGEVVDREPEHVHRREGEQQRKRQGNDWNERVSGASEENVNHDHHQQERDHERRPHVVHGIHNRLRAIE